MGEQAPRPQLGRRRRRAVEVDRVFTEQRQTADADLYAQLKDEYALVGNVNKFALSHNARVASFTMATFAEDTSTLPTLGAPKDVRPYTPLGRVH